MQAASSVPVRLRFFASRRFHAKETQSAAEHVVGACAPHPVVIGEVVADVCLSVDAGSV
jgi:hypothetical protein